MATHIGIGFSQNHDPVLAFKEAAIAAKHQLNQPISDLVLAFGTNAYLADKVSTDALHRILRPKIFIYALTGGILLPKSIETRGIGILAITSDELRFSASIRDQIDFFPMEESGIRLTRDITTTLDAAQRYALFYFLSGIRKNHSPLLRGMQEGLGRAFPILGAVSADGFAGTTSMVGVQDTLSADAVAGLLVGGKPPFAFGIRHGWQPLGRPRTVTSAQGNIIQTIDHKPAISLYDDYFHDELATHSSGSLNTISLLYPLGISTNIPSKPLIRQPIESLSDGSLLCQGDIPVGSKVHLMITDKDSCRNNALSLATEIKEKLQGHQPKLLLVMESIARRKILGRSAWQEIAIIKDTFGLTVPVFGMYTYGEIAPYSVQKNIQNIQAQNAGILIAALG